MGHAHSGVLKYWAKDGVMINIWNKKEEESLIMEDLIVLTLMIMNLNKS